MTLLHKSSLGTAVYPDVLAFSGSSCILVPKPIPPQLFQTCLDLYVHSCLEGG